MVTLLLYELYMINRIFLNIMKLTRQILWPSISIASSLLRQHRQVHQVLGSRDPKDWCPIRYWPECLGSGRDGFVSIREVSCLSNLCWIYRYTTSFNRNYSWLVECSGYIYKSNGFTYFIHKYLPTSMFSNSLCKCQDISGFTPWPNQQWKMQPLCASLKGML